MRRSGKLLSITLALLLLGVVFSLGAYFGYQKRPYIERIENIFTLKASPPKEIDFEPFWKAWDLLESKYVSRDEIDRQELLWGAISGAISAVGDPYTVFLPPEDKELFESEVNGEFEGIGAEIGIRNKFLVIISPLEGSPAMKAGIEAGDRIIKIDEYETLDISIDDAVRRIRGKKGTNVMLTIVRGDESESREISITRDKINIPVLKSSLEDGIFTIRLFNFSAKSPAEFKRAAGEFINSGADKLIIDLRNNPGGFFNAAVDIASWFLPEGETVAIEEIRDQEPKHYRSRGYELLKDYDIVVLVNGGSASASEILAGALQEHGIARVVGTKTFGKGSVQELINVTDDSSLKVTIARWLTPNGRSISKEGLEPDVVLTDEELESGADENATTDPFMIKAIEVLSGKSI